MSERSTGSANGFFAGLRFIIVEDEWVIALMIESVLRGAGAEVAGIAGNVAEALGLIEAVGFDAAILDANLGGETAAPVARVLRERDVPFAVVSGYNRDQRIGPLADAPFVSKPFSPPTLLMAIRSLGHSARLKPAANA